MTSKILQKLMKKLENKQKKLLELEVKLEIIKENENQNWQKNIDPKILKTFEKLGISLIEQKRLVGIESQTESKNSTFGKNEQNGENWQKQSSNSQNSKPKNQENYGKTDENIRQTAVDVVLDSVSIRTTFEKDLAKLGIIFCPISKAITDFPELVLKYFGSVVPTGDNFFACLNLAVFSEGTFVYIPPHIICPMDLSTYFRINAQNTGQFERTLIIADKFSEVSYLEGCTAPEQKQNQLHAAVVELIALEGAKIRYSTVQNWSAGDEKGVGGVYNFVTKRGICQKDAKISWTQVETGSAITWKYPSVVLKGENSVGQFYSVAITKNHQQADTGSKMIHLGKNSKSQIISKSICGDQSSNTYRGLVKIAKNADNCYNFTSCDSLILEKTEKIPNENSTNSSKLNLEKNSKTNSKNSKTLGKNKNLDWTKIEKIIQKLVD